MRKWFKYFAYLRNAQGAKFDDGYYTSLTAARDWARGRGGRYTLTIERAAYGSEADLFVESRTYGMR